MAELHTVRVRHSSGIFDRAERELNQINSDLEGPVELKTMGCIGHSEISEAG